MQEVWGSNPHSSTSKAFFELKLLVGSSVADPVSHLLARPPVPCFCTSAACIAAVTGQLGALESGASAPLPVAASVQAGQPFRSLQRSGGARWCATRIPRTRQGQPGGPARAPADWRAKPAASQGFSSLGHARWPSVVRRRKPPPTPTPTPTCDTTGPPRGASGSGCPQLRRPAATGPAADGLSPPLESSAPHGARGSRLSMWPFLLSAERKCPLCTTLSGAAAAAPGRRRSGRACSPSQSSGSMS